MTEYRQTMRRHSEAFASYHAGIARQTRSDRETRERHIRIARRWKRAAQVWGA